MTFIAVRVARAGGRSGPFARGEQVDTGLIATGKPLKAAACPCHTMIA